MANAQHLKEPQSTSNQTLVYFITLPNELITRITSYLNPGSLLKLRLVFPKGYSELVQKILEPILERIYVMPTQGSLDRFSAICHSDFFRRHIREVVLINRPVNRSPFVDTFEKFVKDAEEMAGHKGSWLKSAIDNPPWQQEAWSLYNELCRENELCIEKRKDQRDEPKSDKAMCTLAIALSRLPRLCRAAVQCWAKKPGLNLPCVFASDTRNYQGKLQHDSYARKLAAWAAGYTPLYAGAEVFLRAIVNSNIYLDDLTLGGNGPCCQLQYNLDNFGYMRESVMASIAANLTTLVVSCTWFYDEDEDVSWISFISAVKELQSLKVYIDMDTYDDEDKDDGEYRSDINDILRADDMPALRTLRLVGTHFDGVVLDTLMFQRFLDGRTGTLTSLELRDLLIVDDEGERDVCDTVRLTLDWIRDELRPEHFVMSLSRACWHAARDEPCTKYSRRCDGVREEFWVRFQRSLDCSDLDDLAEEMGVLYNSKGWDFSEYVMRGVATDSKA